LNLKHKHWCGFPADYGWKAAPVLVFDDWIKIPSDKRFIAGWLKRFLIKLLSGTKSCCGASKWFDARNTGRL